MPELALVPPPPARELRRLLRARLPRLEPDLHVIAEDVAGLDGRIDLVAAERGGRVVLVLCGRERDRDLGLIAEGLAQRTAIAGRLAEWVQLAPALELDALRSPRVLLFAPRFGPKALAAARAAGAVELVEYRCVRAGGDVGLLLEPLEPPEPAPPAVRSGPPGSGAGDRHGDLSDPRTDESPPRGREPVPGLPGRPGAPPRARFRTGLTASDLRPRSPRRDGAG